MKSTIIAVCIGITLVGGAFALSKKSGSTSTVPSENNVSVVDGKQIVTIGAKGGFSPQLTTAKADMPTILRVKTQGTFDCSSTLNIPSLSYQENLPPTGTTDIEIPPQRTLSRTDIAGKTRRPSGE